jgi:membrane protease YdiL (CAAX protease family)
MSNVVSTEPSPLWHATSDYLGQSRRPLASLLFVLPLLVLYEGGVIWLGPDAIRNGADLWMQQLLGVFGFGGFLLMPIITIGILLAWHHTTRESWRMPASVLYGMAAECSLLALLLVIIARLHAAVLSISGLAVPCEVGTGAATQWFLGELVRYFGAGIYEELMFRLMLLPVVIGLIGLLVVSPRTCMIGGVVITSLVFSAAHYIGPYGEPLVAYTFVFRAVAGAFFAVLFVYRGFGIAAGTHALYDIFVGFPN